MSSWKEDIIEALFKLGGEAHLDKIYEEVEKNRLEGELTSDWKNTLRTVIYQNSSDAKAYLKHDDLFYKGEKLGVWGLRNFSTKRKVIDYKSEFLEGKKKLKIHKQRERNPKIIKLAKERFIQKQGTLYCEICGFDFEVTYGERGKGFIEAHHSKPVSELKKKEKTKIEDIVMVCSNCHRMLHKRPWIKKKQLKKILNVQHPTTSVNHIKNH